MCFSNTSSDADDCAGWVSFADSYEWGLTEGAGIKTVYVFLKDDAGNIRSYSDTIELI